MIWITELDRLLSFIPLSYLTSTYDASCRLCGRRARMQAKASALTGIISSRPTLESLVSYGAPHPCDSPLSKEQCA